MGIDLRVRKRPESKEENFGPDILNGMIYHMTGTIGRNSPGMATLQNRLPAIIAEQGALRNQMAQRSGRYRERTQERLRARGSLEVNGLTVPLANQTAGAMRLWNDTIESGIRAACNINERTRAVCSELKDPIVLGVEFFMETTPDRVKESIITGYGSTKEMLKKRAISLEESHGIPQEITTQFYRDVAYILGIVGGAFIWNHLAMKVPKSTKGALRAEMPPTKPLLPGRVSSPIDLTFDPKSGIWKMRK